MNPTTSAIAEARQAAQEAILKARVRRGELAVECGCCGECISGDQVVFGDEWTCRECAANETVSPGMQLAGLLVLVVMVAN
jgi:hypothetical protein